MNRRKFVLGSTALFGLIIFCGFNARTVQAKAITSKFDTGLVEKSTTEYGSLNSTAAVATLKKIRL
ncbi:hypothetical protein [Pediococcus ethanolidurans]